MKSSWRRRWPATLLQRIAFGMNCALQQTGAVETADSGQEQVSSIRNGVGHWAKSRFPGPDWSLQFSRATLEGRIALFSVFEPDHFRPDRGKLADPSIYCSKVLYDGEDASDSAKLSCQSRTWKLLVSATVLREIALDNVNAAAG